MQLRPYQSGDAAVIASWVCDERTHALWCANLFPYPATAESFEALRADVFARRTARCYVATDIDGVPVGCFFLHKNEEKRDAYLTFVVVDSHRRGEGLGTAMLRLAAGLAFSDSSIDTLSLTVFAENTAALRCYHAVGFDMLEQVPNAFPFRDECWGRCRMSLKRTRHMSEV